MDYCQIIKVQTEHFLVFKTYYLCLHLHSTSLNFGLVFVLYIESKNEIKKNIFFRKIYF